MQLFSVIMHFFLGAGAVAGGLGAIINPVNPMGITPDSLRYGPFTTFLIPGIILFGLLGLGNIVSGILALRRVKFSEYLAGLMGLIMVAWITVQCLMMGSIYFLHVIYFVFGAAQGIASIYLLYNRNMFPLNF